MGTAIIRGLLAKGVYDAGDVVVAEVVPEARTRLAQELGVRVTADVKEAVAAADVVVVAVKPHLILPIMQGCREALGKQLLISIAAGVTLDSLQQSTVGAPGVRWVRVMPNVACTVGESASTFFAAPECVPADVDVTKKILSACGIAVALPNEGLLDAATGTSGSGIAYIFLVLEAIADGGVRAGLPRPIAQQLATQTVLGAAKLQKQTGTHPGVLKDSVCSPGGTTIEAVATLERQGLRSSMIEAVQSAFLKARDLGEKAKAAEKAKAKL
eukprot:TRINITY_DN30266_c0_g1_i1.p1 TRINITY_DN30266_c0_g1~~TRINITY_DN30266_c0_g1_i1.p1  ORF type:complete len:299 (+),score=109.97 TRINITY_DN30266_c0_g1_i1:85-897(+)